MKYSQGNAEYSDTLARLTRVVEVLDSRYPYLKISLGYIGSIHSWGDDRAWGVFVKFPDHADCDMFGRYSSSKLSTLLAEVEKGRFYDWLHETWDHRGDELVGVEFYF